ncbi:MAG: energy transducer TonB [Bacteroidales bacterium]|jgi:protein TonB|nr:energy transducer TonB [Bacteroidales bacterium]
MQEKKSSSANLEIRRPIHFQIGLIVVLSIVLISLEWTSPLSDSGLEYQLTPASTIEPILLPIIPREDKPKPREILPVVFVPVDIDELDLSVLEDMLVFNTEYTNQGIVIVDYDLPPDVVEEPVHRDLVEIRAEFLGGDDALMKWIYSNIKYPSECSENGVEGRVIAKFTISKFGKVIDIEIVRRVHPDLDAEVERVLGIMPDFRPAMQNLELVPVFMYWPIIFRLE